METIWYLLELVPRGSKSSKVSSYLLEGAVELCEGGDPWLSFLFFTCLDAAEVPWNLESKTKIKKKKNMQNITKAKQHEYP